MWENSSNPCKACSGFVKTFLEIVNFPGTFPQTTGCLGVPFLFENHVEMVPIGRRVKVSFRLLLVEDSLIFTQALPGSNVADSPGKHSGPVHCDFKRLLILLTSFS